MGIAHWTINNVVIYSSVVLPPGEFSRMMMILAPLPVCFDSITMIAATVLP